MCILKLMKVSFAAYRIVAIGCLLLYVAACYGDISTGRDSISTIIFFLLVCLIYATCAAIPSRYKEVALGTTLGLVGGGAAMYLSKYGIIFLLVKTSRALTLFWYSNLLLCLLALLIWIIFWRSVRHAIIVLSALSLFTTVVGLFGLLMLA